MTKALVVVDVQNDFCEGGSLAVEGGSDVATAVRDLVTGGAYDIAVATKDHHIDPGGHFSEDPDFVESWPVHCVAETAGAEFRPPLEEAQFESVFRKGQYDAGYSGFGGIDADGATLAEWLRDRGVDTIEVCGIATDFCVRATALDGVRLGFGVTVLRSFTAAVSPVGLPAVVRELDEAGVTVS